MRQGLTATLAMGVQAQKPYILGLLAEAYGEGGRAAAGLHALAEVAAGAFGDSYIP
jgi:hypothetical protein